MTDKSPDTQVTTGVPFTYLPFPHGGGVWRRAVLVNESSEIMVWLPKHDTLQVGCFLTLEDDPTETEWVVASVSRETVNMVNFPVPPRSDAPS